MKITAFNPMILTKKPEETMLFLKPLALSVTITKAIIQKMKNRDWLFHLFV